MAAEVGPRADVAALVAAVVAATRVDTSSSTAHGVLASAETRVEATRNIVRAALALSEAKPREVLQKVLEHFCALLLEFTKHTDADSEVGVSTLPSLFDDDDGYSLLEDQEWTMLEPNGHTAVRLSSESAHEQSTREVDICALIACVEVSLALIGLVSSSGGDTTWAVTLILRDMCVPLLCTKPRLLQVCTFLPLQNASMATSSTTRGHTRKMQMAGHELARLGVRISQLIVLLLQTAPRSNCPHTLWLVRNICAPSLRTALANMLSQTDDDVEAAQKSHESLLREALATEPPPPWTPLLWRLHQLQLYSLDCSGTTANNRVASSGDAVWIGNPEGDYLCEAADVMYLLATLLEVTAERDVGNATWLLSVTRVDMLSFLVQLLQGLVASQGQGPANRRLLHLVETFCGILLQPLLMDLDSECVESGATYSSAKNEVCCFVEQISRLWSEVSALIACQSSVARDLCLTIIHSLGDGLFASSTRARSANALDGVAPLRLGASIVLDSMQFWSFINDELRSSDAKTRKVAIHILGQALNARPVAEKNAWDLFIDIYKSLENFPAHLLIESSSRLEQIHRCCTNASSDAVASLSFHWISVLWHRGFSHENPQVRRLFASSFISDDWALELFLQAPARSRQDFLLSQLLGVLGDPKVHPDFGFKGLYESDIGRKAASFFGAVALHEQTRGGSEVKQLLLRTLEVVSQRKWTRVGQQVAVACIRAIAVCAHERKPSSGCDNGEPWGGGPEALMGEEMQRAVECLISLHRSAAGHFSSRYRLQLDRMLLEIASLCIDPSICPSSMLASLLYELPRDTLFGTDSLVLVRRWLCPTVREQRGLADQLETSLREMLSTGLDNTDTVSAHEIDCWKEEALKWTSMVLLLSDHDTVKQLTESIASASRIIYSRTYLARGTEEKILIYLHALIDLASELKALSHSEFFDQLRVDLLPCVHEVISFCRASTESVWSELDALMKRDANRLRIEEHVGQDAGPSLLRLLNASTSMHPVNRLRQELVVLVQRTELAVSSVCSLYSLMHGPASETGKDADWAVSIKECGACLHNELLRQLDGYWEQTALEQLQERNAVSEEEAILRLCALEHAGKVARSLVRAQRLGGEHRAQGADESLHETAAKVLPLLVSERKDIEYGLTSATIGFQSSSEAHNTVKKAFDRTHFRARWRTMRPVLEIATSHGVASGSPRLSLLERVLALIISQVEVAGEEDLVELLSCLSILFTCGAHDGLMQQPSPSGTAETLIDGFLEAAWSNFISCLKKVELVIAFVGACFHPRLFAYTQLHAQGDSMTTTGSMQRLVQRIVKCKSKQPRLFRLFAPQFAALLVMFPDIGHQYIHAIPHLALYGADSNEETCDDYTTFEEQFIDSEHHRALLRPLDPELYEVYRRSFLYPRVSLAVALHGLGCQLRRGSVNLDGAPEVSLGAGVLNLLLGLALHDKELANEIYLRHTIVHRRKVRLWQLICALADFVTEESHAQVLRDVDTCLHLGNHSSVRQYIETFMVSILLRFPKHVTSLLEPALRDWSCRTQIMASYVMIAANVVLHNSEEARETYFQALFPHIVPWMASHHHNLRNFSQVIVHKLLRERESWEGPGSLLAELSLSDSEQDAVGNRRYLRQVWLFLSENPDCKKILEAGAAEYLDKFNLELATTPRGIFCFGVAGWEVDSARASSEETFECVPTALLDHVNDFLRGTRSQLRQMNAEFYEAARELSVSVQSNTNGAGPQHYGTSLELFGNFQRKVAGYLEYQNEEEGYARPPVNSAEEDLMSKAGLEPERMQKLHEHGPRQDIIFVASLVDKAPNLGGLARTCEVFQCAALVVNDMRIAKDPVFRSLSMTAELWVPIWEVPEQDLERYLKRKKAQGYTLVGVEQTTKSVRLDAFNFPKSCVLLMGREKEGIPPSLLRLMEHTVEIPQLGVVRSLNVHVSGAIALWEYSRQHKFVRR